MSDPSWPDPPTAGRMVRLPLPLPPMLLDAAGYTGGARYVALFWMPYGDELMLADGQITATGWWPAFTTLAHHPLGQIILGPVRARLERQRGGALAAGRPARRHARRRARARRAAAACHPALRARGGRPRARRRPGPPPADRPVQGAARAEPNRGARAPGALPPAPRRAPRLARRRPSPVSAGHVGQSPRGRSVLGRPRPGWSPARRRASGAGTRPPPDRDPRTDRRPAIAQQGTVHLIHLERPYRPADRSRRSRRDRPGARSVLARGPVPRAKAAPPQELARPAVPDLPPTTGERRRSQPGLHGLTSRRLRGLRAAGHPPPRFSRPAGAWGSGRRPAARTGPRPEKENTDGRKPERPHAQATHRRAAGRAPRPRPRARPPGSRAAAQLRRMAPVVDHACPIHLLQPDESAPGRHGHARRDPGGRVQGVAEPRVLRKPRGKGRHPYLDADSRRPRSSSTIGAPRAAIPWRSLAPASSSARSGTGRRSSRSRPRPCPRCSIRRSTTSTATSSPTASPR